MQGRDPDLIQHYRQIMANEYGRELMPSEQVHHIDGDPYNNARRNLAVMSQSAHFWWHQVLTFAANNNAANMGHRTAYFINQAERALASMAEASERAEVLRHFWQDPRRHAFGNAWLDGIKPRQTLEGRKPSQARAPDVEA